MQFGRAVILGAVQRDQHVAVEDTQLVERAGLLQFGERVGEGRVELRRLDRIEHGADLIVAGDPIHPEQGLAVGAALTRRQMPLMRQKGRALHEERGERGHAEIGHGVGRVLPLPLVGNRPGSSDERQRSGGPSCSPRQRIDKAVAPEAVIRLSPPICPELLHSRLSPAPSARPPPTPPEAPIRRPDRHAAGQNENCCNRPACLDHDRR